MNQTNTLPIFETLLGLPKDLTAGDTVWLLFLIGIFIFGVFSVGAHRIRLSPSEPVVEKPQDAPTVNELEQ